MSSIMLRPFSSQMLALGVGTVLLLGAVAVAQTSSSPAPGGATQAVVAIDPAVLAQSVRGEITRLGGSAAVEDYEAAILFVVSQQNYDGDSIRTALETVLAEPSTPENAKTAIKNILLQLARRRFNRGTGALGNNGGAGFGASGFSTPVVSVGGGTSGYQN